MKKILTRDKALEWHFKPRKLYKQGIPQNYQSSLEHSASERKILDEILQSSKATKALEIGPGRTPVIERFHDKTYLDVSPGILAQISTDGRRAVGKVQNIGKMNEKFGIAVANSVLTHVPPEKRLRAIQGLAKVADELVIGDMSGFKIHKNDLKKINLDASHCVSQKMVEDELEKQGFEIVKKIGFDRKQINSGFEKPFETTSFLIYAKKKK